MRWAAVVLLAWWAVFRWEPVAEPPAYVVFGPFDSRAQCHEWVVRARPTLESVGWTFERCVDREVL